MRAAALVAAALVATCCAFEPATLLLVALIGGSVPGLVLVAAGIQRLATVWVPIALARHATARTRV
jgi:hypothetical protein